MYLILCNSLAMFGWYPWETDSSLKGKGREVDKGGRREVVGEGKTVVRMEYMREEKINTF